MSKPPKIDRKTLKQPDKFTTRGRGALEWLVHERMRYLPLLIAVVVLVLGGYGFDWWSNGRMEDAWRSYTTASKATEPQKWDDLKGVANAHKSSRPGVFASVALADHFFSEAKKQSMGEAKMPPAVVNGVKDPKAPDVKLPADEKAAMASAATAAEWYSRALEFSELLPGEKQLLYINRGESLEMQKKYDEALNDYKMAADFAGDTKPLAMLGTGRVHELKNDKVKAAETYERITVDFSNTEYAKMAKNLLRRLKSPLFTEGNS